MSVVPDALTAAASLAFGVAPLGVQAAQVGEELVGELAAGQEAGPDGENALQHAGGVGAVISLPKPPGTRSASTAWSRQATWVRAQVPIALGPHLQHRRVILCGHRASLAT
jgi:hypothetical protein